MKIGMLTSTLQTCGIGDYTRALMGGLSKVADVECVSVWRGEQPWQKYLAESSGKLNACDVVHIQHEYSFWSLLPGWKGLLGSYFTQISGLKPPLVVTAHTLDTLPQLFRIEGGGGLGPKTIAKRILAATPRFRRAVERDVFDAARRIIVHDQANADRLISRGIDASKIRIVPMGVPAPDIKPGAGDAFRAKHGLHERKLIMVFGFVRPGRGYERVMQALPELEEAALVIAGGPQVDVHKAYMESLKAQVEAAGLKDRVLITGYLPDAEVAGVMQAADVVLCSQETGTGSYSVQVALGYGRPVVASDLPCFTDLEKTSECLVTYARADTADLVGKLKRVLRDASLSARLSEKALAHAERCSWDNIALMTKQVYEELAGNKQ